MNFHSRSSPPSGRRAELPATSRDTGIVCPGAACAYEAKRGVANRPVIHPAGIASKSPNSQLPAVGRALRQCASRAIGSLEGTRVDPARPCPGAPASAAERRALVSSRGATATTEELPG
jgi:hypothetical protein